MRRSMYAMMTACLLLAACSRVVDAPAAEQLRRDLVGREFFYVFDWKSAAGQKWAVKEGEVKELVVRKGTSRDSGKAYEVPAYVTLSDGKRTIRGVLVFRYSRADNGWKLSLVSPRDGRPGKSFSFDVLALENP